MKIWIQNKETKKIICAITAPKGYSARTLFFNFLEQEKIKDKQNYKIVYKNPFTSTEE